MGIKLETEQMKVLSFLTSGQAAPERNGGDVERSDRCVRWRPSKATTWRGRHHLNLPHHQVEQYGGTPALWSAARKTFAEHQGDKRVGRRSSGALEARRGRAEGF